MKLYEYIADVLEDTKKTKNSQFNDFKVKKNKSGTSTLITRPNGEKYMMVDLNKLRR